MYLLLDNQKGYEVDHICYYPVPVVMGSGNTIRVPVEVEKFLQAVKTR
jgi:hypothetical protein